MCQLPRCRPAPPGGTNPLPEGEGHFDRPNKRPPLPWGKRAAGEACSPLLAKGDTPTSVEIYFFPIKPARGYASIWKHLGWSAPVIARMRAVKTPAPALRCRRGRVFFLAPDSFVTIVNGLIGEGTFGRVPSSNLQWSIADGGQSEGLPLSSRSIAKSIIFNH